MTSPLGLLFPTGPCGSGLKPMSVELHLLKQILW